MVAIVADKCFEEGFRPLTWITHPTCRKHPTTKFLSATYAGALCPGLALTSVHQSVSWPLLLHSGVPPWGGLGYTITAFADVNNWASKVMFWSCFISTSILGKLGIQEPQILYFSKIQCKSLLWSPGLVNIVVLSLPFIEAAAKARPHSLQPQA